jgi:hypothetical protein
MVANRLVAPGCRALLGSHPAQRKMSMVSTNFANLRTRVPPAGPTVTNGLWRAVARRGKTA